MKTLPVRNVTKALELGLTYIRSHGVLRETRNGPALVCPSPVTTIYEKPRERVLFSNARDANPFFHFFESLWMLAGQRNGKFLNYFVKDFTKRFSDDGTTLHGAYGYRWREQWGDQLAIIVDRLKNDPSDRRSVLQIWSADLDLGKTSRDLPCNTTVFFWVSEDDSKTGESPRLELNMTVCNRSNDIIWGCLSGDTEILSPEGARTIRQLTEEGLNKPFPVYSVNPATGDMAIKNCVRAWSTGIKPVIELVFDNGSTLRLTKDHNLYVKNTKRGVTNTPEDCIVETPAGHLKVGDRLWAPVPQTRKGRKVFKRNILKNTAYENIQFISREYYKFCKGDYPEGWHVHHINENTEDDKIENLSALSPEEHLSLHMKRKMGKLSQEDKVVLATRGSAAAKAAYQNLSSEEREALNKKRTRHASETFKAHWASLSEKQHYEIAKKASEAAREKNTPEAMRERQKKAVESRLQNKKLKELAENHVIVEIRELPPEETFDFTVEDYHTALIGDGVLAHNCYGANAVHFSMLQEYVATSIGATVGRYWQISNNWHAYLETLEPLEEKYKTQGFYDFANFYNDWKPGSVEPYPLMTESREIWDQDLLIFIDQGPIVGMRDPFFRRVATPMWYAWLEWKRDDRSKNDRIITAIEILQQCAATDWKKAAVEWLERRIQK